MWRIWLAAARPRTLAAGIVPVAVGTAAAGVVAPVSAWLAIGAAAGALLIQVGCNFANDAFDGLKGADTPDRLGPTRAVAAGLVSPAAMLRATALVLLLALGVGLGLAFPGGGGWGILVLGLVSLVCAVAYTAGPLPLAYVGLGDLFVFLFFGLAAVVGSAWLHVAALLPADLGGGPFRVAGAGLAALGWGYWALAAAVGAQATAIIAVNNLRDIPTDGPVGKRTLAVRLGDPATRWYYLGLHLAAAGALAAVAAAAGGWWWLPAGVAGAGGIGCWLGLRRASGRALNPWLGRTAAVELATGLAVIAAVALK